MDGVCVTLPRLVHFAFNADSFDHIDWPWPDRVMHVTLTPAGLGADAFGSNASGVDVSAESDGTSRDRRPARRFPIPVLNLPRHFFKKTPGNVRAFRG